MTQNVLKFHRMFKVTSFSALRQATTTSNNTVVALWEVDMSVEAK